ncbi:hypothetical protein BHE74_00023452 [Ensete ventricosum]|nr:hypothetical protein GW17_00031407 [Ensete ventricosum]RWW68983.1 hypothetical protein BHE74_00023452 [Ensete ventricosum]RZR91349.1 hypothetical protein BHM03_00019447 [Ensete ventricosum]
MGKDGVWAWGLKDEGGRKETGRGIKEITEMRSSQHGNFFCTTFNGASFPLQFHCSPCHQNTQEKEEERDIFTPPSLATVTWSLD